MKPFTAGLILGRKLKEDPGKLLKILSEAGNPEQEPQPTPDIPDIDSILPSVEPYRSIAQAVVNGNVTKARELSAKAAQKGVDPLDIAREGLLKGMDVISVLYAHRRVFVPEVLLAARALEAGIEESGGDRGSIGNKGVVILHTADGDLHDIGKNIVGAIVEANGFQVIDLGTSVSTTQVIEAIREHQPIAVLGSSLMTSTRNAFLSTADELKKAGISIPFIVGGGACDQVFVTQRENIRYAKDPDGVVKILGSL